MALEVLEEYLVWEHSVESIEELHLISTKIILEELEVQVVLIKILLLEIEEECKEVLVIINLEDIVE